jgi:hypothetical protein
MPVDIDKFDHDFRSLPVFGDIVREISRLPYLCGLFARFRGSAVRRW